jgi:hypothetical protein
MKAFDELMPKSTQPQMTPEEADAYMKKIDEVLNG